MRYELSAAENIGFDADRREQIHEAARRAGALRLIEGMPHGFDTILSPRLAEGTDLSGGQWQRGALARALFAVDRGADILVLDEPTANLDVRAEVELYEARR